MTCSGHVHMVDAAVAQLTVTVPVAAVAGSSRPCRSSQFGQHMLCECSHAVSVLYSCFHSCTVHAGARHRSARHSQAAKVSEAVFLTMQQVTAPKVGEAVSLTMQRVAPVTGMWPVSSQHKAYQVPKEASWCFAVPAKWVKGSALVHPHSLTAGIRKAGRCSLDACAEWCISHLLCLRDLCIAHHFGPRSYADPAPFATALQLNTAVQQDGQEFLKLLLQKLEHTFAASQQQVSGCTYAQHRGMDCTLTAAVSSRQGRSDQCY